MFQILIKPGYLDEILAVEIWLEIWEFSANS